MGIVLEIAAFNLNAAAVAEMAGADRIELCDNYLEGGTTPSLGIIEAAKKILNVPVFVMIRPRGGDFVYDDVEFSVMKRDIELCRNAGVDGVVFGLLNKDKTIDAARCADLKIIAGDMQTTFHKAFDEIPDKISALNTLIEMKFQRVLTSGGAANALEGMEILKELEAHAAEKIKVIAAGGIRSSNVKEVIDFTGIKEVHSAAINKNNLFPFPSVDEIKAIKESYKYHV